MIRQRLLVLLIHIYALLCTKNPSQSMRQILSHSPKGVLFKRIQFL